MRAILTYHSIDRSGSIISVTPDAFRSHIEWLAKGNVLVVGLTELLALSDDVNAVALTFDDGLVSVASEAAPLLAAHAFPATVFVVSEHVGLDNRWNGGADPAIPVQKVLGWDALGQLRSQGFTIGAHTRRHRHLQHCSNDEVADEMGGSADDIAAALGDRPATFAYPYGTFSPRVARIAAEHYDLSCTTEFQPVHADTPREKVPRLDAWYYQNAKMLRHWGDPIFALSVTMGHALRRARRKIRRAVK